MAFDPKAPNKPPKPPKSGDSEGLNDFFDQLSDLEAFDQEAQAGEPVGEEPSADELEARWSKALRGAVETAGQPAGAAPSTFHSQEAPAAPSRAAGFSRKTPKERPAWLKGIKVVVLALLLFGLGLGGGLFLLMQPDDEPNPWSADDGKAASTAAPMSDPGQGSSLPAPPPPFAENLPVEPQPPVAPAAKTDNTAAPGPLGGLSAAPAKTIQAAPPAPPKPQPTIRPAASPAPAQKPQPAKTPAKAPAKAGPRFALQVGACQSDQCKAVFLKQLKEAGVEDDRIHLAQATRNGKTVQKILVQPLTRPEAAALKEKLAKADKRFAGAYLIPLK